MASAKRVGRLLTLLSSVFVFNGVLVFRFALSLFRGLVTPEFLFMASFNFIPIGAQY